jgi:hypothetical protein
MADLTAVDRSRLRTAVDEIQERAEQQDGSESFAKSYVDTHVLATLLPIKNQLVYGRRGTGKTHLLRRMEDHYASAFSERRELPIYIDGRNIEHVPFEGDTVSVGLLISYRRFMDEVANSLETLFREEVSLGAADRMFRWAAKRKKADAVKQHLDRLRRLSRFGDVEPGPATGTYTKEISEQRSQSSGLMLDAQVRASAAAGPTASAGGGIKAAAASERATADALSVTYEALSILNFQQFAAELSKTLDLLGASAIVVLFDEWSAIDPARQPAFADMIRKTLAPIRTVVVKFACIPFRTRLSATTSSGQAVGYPVGEEVFVGADLDRLFSSFWDPGNATVFLLQVLHRHLALNVDELDAASPDEAIQWLRTQVFEDERAINELVSASAGIPRDFLRIFAIAFRGDQTPLPISRASVRRAIQECFSQEKFGNAGDLPAACTELYAQLFKKICMPARTPFFFVSTDRGRDEVLLNLWNRRLIHLVHQGFFATSGGVPNTYDIYAMDYGRFVSMRNQAGGEKLAATAYGVFGALINVLLPGTGDALASASVPAAVVQLFAGMIAGVKATDVALAPLLEDASAVVADELLSAGAVAVT